MHSILALGNFVLTSRHKASGFAGITIDGDGPRWICRAAIK